MREWCPNVILVNEYTRRSYVALRTETLLSHDFYKSFQDLGVPRLLRLLVQFSLCHLVSLFLLEVAGTAILVNEFKPWVKLKFYLRLADNGTIGAEGYTAVPGCREHAGCRQQADGHFVLSRRLVNGETKVIGAIFLGSPCECLYIYSPVSRGQAVVNLRRLNLAL